MTRPDTIMYSRLRRPPLPRVALADYELPYLELESAAPQRRSWRRIAKPVNRKHK